MGRIFPATPNIVEKVCLIHSFNLFARCCGHASNTAQFWVVSHVLCVCVCVCVCVCEALLPVPTLPHSAQLAPQSSLLLVVGTREARLNACAQLQTHTNTLACTCIHVRTHIHTHAHTHAWYRNGKNSFAFFRRLTRQKTPTNPSSSDWKGNTR